MSNIESIDPDEVPQTAMPPFFKLSSSWYGAITAGIGDGNTIRLMDDASHASSIDMQLIHREAAKKVY